MLFREFLATLEAFQLVSMWPCKLIL